MQLNNIKTGQVVKVTIKPTTIVYDIYENGIVSKLELLGNRCVLNTSIDKTLSPPQPLLSLLENEVILGCNTLKATKEFESEDWIVSNDVSNWKVDGEFYNRNTRILIPKSLIVEHIALNDELGQLILAVMSTVREGTITSDNFILVYLQYLEPAHKAILDKYPTIIIENKL